MLGVLMAIILGVLIGAVVFVASSLTYGVIVGGVVFVLVNAARFAQRDTGS
jgi:hypothetical protein